MPRSRDADFEKLVGEVAVESFLQPSEYFVQNVVDLQDLLDIRHCVFTIGDSGNNKSEAWKTLAKVWTKGGVRGKTICKPPRPPLLLLPLHSHLPPASSILHIRSLPVSPLPLNLSLTPLPVEFSPPSPTRFRLLPPAKRLIPSTLLSSHPPLLPLTRLPLPRPLPTPSRPRHQPKGANLQRALRLRQSIDARVEGRAALLHAPRARHIPRH